MELVVQQSPVDNPLKRWGLNWPAKRSERAESHVVEHDEQDIWGIGESSGSMQSAWFGVMEQACNVPTKGL